MTGSLSPTPKDAAIEAAARALAGDSETQWIRWRELVASQKHFGSARIALAAAVPLVLEEAARRIEAAVAAHHDETGKWVRGADIAAAAVRSLAEDWSRAAGGSR